MLKLLMRGVAVLAAVAVFWVGVLVVLGARETDREWGRRRRRVVFPTDRGRVPCRMQGRTGHALRFLPAHAGKPATPCRRI